MYICVCAYFHIRTQKKQNESKNNNNNGCSVRIHTMVYNIGQVTRTQVSHTYSFATQLTTLQRKVKKQKTKNTENCKRWRHLSQPVAVYVRACTTHRDTHKLIHKVLPKKNYYQINKWINDVHITSGNIKMTKNERDEYIFCFILFSLLFCVCTRESNNFERKKRRYSSTLV